MDGNNLAAVQDNRYNNSSFASMQNAFNQHPQQSNNINRFGGNAASGGFQGQQVHQRGGGINMGGPQMNNSHLGIMNPSGLQQQPQSTLNGFMQQSNGAGRSLGTNSTSNYNNPSGEILAMLGKQSQQQQQQVNMLQQLNMGNNPTSNMNDRGVKFDLADFPALANRVAGMGLQDNQAGGGDNNNSLNYSMHVGQQQQQRHHNDFAIQSEDFPALPGFSANDNSNTGVVDNQNRDRFAGTPSNSAFDGMNANQLLRQQQQRDVAFMSMNNLNKSSLLKTGNTAPNPQSTSPRLSANSTGVNSDQRYGLLGLLSVIRMEDAGRGTLALGSDLTTFGLNLNSSESLYTTFASPWAESPSNRDPQFTLPACYQQTASRTGGSLGINTSHFSKFQVETLFYIFYSMTRDVMQMLAAQELYNRDWRYHSELKLWFAQAPNDGNSSQMQFIYFDINSWERRIFSGSIPGGIQHGFLQKDVLIASQ